MAGGTSQAAVMTIERASPGSNWLTRRWSVLASQSASARNGLPLKGVLAG